MEDEAFQKFLKTGTIESFLEYKDIQRLNGLSTTDDIEEIEERR